MARTRTAGRPAQPSSAQRRNPRRPRARDLSRSYRVDLSDDSSLSDHGTDAQSADESDSGIDASGSNVNSQQRPLRHSGRNGTRRSPRNKAKSARTPTKGVKRSRGNTRNESQRPPKQPRLSSEPQPTETQGIIPDWKTPAIPYGAWVDIFTYAASESSTDSLDSNWLIHAATTCQMFLEPALAAMYRSAPVRTAAKARRLISLLERPPSETRINYRSKVESLDVDVQVVPQGILFDLIRFLTRLRELIFFTRSDQPPYRELDNTIRWSYPEDIFRALMPINPGHNGAGGKESPTFLRSWEWSQSLMGSYVLTIQDIGRIHQTAPFSHLTRLSFTNFQVPSLHRLQPRQGDEEAVQQIQHGDNAIITAVGEAISQVRGLKYLVFESSTVMNDRLLPMLPKDLVHLGLINCWEIKSEDLGPFLRTHGSKLRSLSLLHNQSLDLAYLTDLADTCPNLLELRMNLSYYRHHETIDDGDPMYDQALYPDQVPKWPRGLRIIDFEHIRDWSVETAEMFLQSLIDQAEFLPQLRHLAIKTNLDIPWQARATMRREWREKMERVFLRPFVPPRRITSIRQQDDVKEAPVLPPKRRNAHLTSPSRRSGRIATQEPARGSSARDSKGLRHERGKPLYRDPDTDEDEFDLSDGDNDEDHDSNADRPQPQGDDTEPPQQVIQGQCTTVSITFDNQKVRELQYGMEDFRSEDNESEEEWDGDFEEEDYVMQF